MVPNALDNVAINICQALAGGGDGDCDAAAPQLPELSHLRLEARREDLGRGGGRGLHSSTFQANVHAFRGIGGAFEGCLGGAEGCAGVLGSV
jgi:hypothetical protein